jgi:hypothetical protein
MSDNIRTFKLTGYFSIATLVLAWMSIFTLTSTQIVESMPGFWLIDLLSAIIISMGLCYGAIVIRRLAKVLGTAIDVLAVFY